MSGSNLGRQVWTNQEKLWTIMGKRGTSSRTTWEIPIWRNSRRFWHWNAAMMKSSQRPVCIPSRSMMDEHGRPNQAMLHTRLLPNMLILFWYIQVWWVGRWGSEVWKRGETSCLLVDCPMQHGEFRRIVVVQTVQNRDGKCKRLICTHAQSYINYIQTTIHTYIRTYVPTYIHT